jgi:hypothetical protein
MDIVRTHRTALGQEIQGPIHGVTTATEAPTRILLGGVNVFFFAIELI